ncbi:MAG: carboxypeptidase regulatory-like domain-containing protein [Bryobacteraceae bacterium]|jgi:protocatechuate 3,4-dioxygenase beta subunit
MRKSLALTYICSVFFFPIYHGLAAQTANSQTGANAPATKPEDLCALAGRVVNAATNEPVNKVAVTLTRTNPTPGVAGLPRQFGTSSDASGRFAMKDLEPGTYRLQVSRNGFVTAEYGARSPSSPGTPLTLSRAQQPQDLVIRMTPHAVVSGRIVDQDGEPVASVMVQLLKLQYAQGKKRLQTAGSAQTNDLGEYRAFGLAPGKYYISAGMVLTAAAAALTEDKSAEPRPEESDVTTYYPGVTDSAAATPVDVTAGVQLRGIDMTLARRRTARIRGRVNAPAPASMLILAPRSLAGALSMQMVRVDPKGEFDIHGVAPGSYALSGSVQQSGKTYLASLPIDVGQSDIEGLTLSIVPGVVVAGRVRVDGETKADLANVKVQMQPHEMGIGALMSAMGSVMSGGGIGANSGKLAADLSFQLENTSADRYDVTVTGLPEGFYVKSIRSGDDDVLLQGLEVEGAAPEPLDILVSPHAGQVTGSVQNPTTQQPAAQAIVALVPQEKDRRDQPSFYRQVSSDASGGFTFKSLPPGQYKVFAWEDVESGAWMDPDFIKPLEDKGEAVTLAESGQESVQVKLIPAGAPPAKPNGQ